MRGAVKRYGFLKKEEFENFLKIVRRIAVFDTNRRLWFLDKQKIINLYLQNILEDTINELEKYAEIDKDFVEEVIREYEYNAMKAVITRKNGKAVLQFSSVPPQDIINGIIELCTLVYRIEKPVISPEGEYEGSEIVEKHIKSCRLLSGNKVVVFPVALINDIHSFLSKKGYNVMLDITVAPDIKVNLYKKFELMPHQEDAYRLWSAKKRGTIAIFTRGGKSFIALNAIYETKKPTLILVTTRELMQTWINYLKNYLGLNEAYIGVLGGGECKLRDITIATYNSAVKYADRLIGRFELVVFDESHHVPAMTFKEVALKIDSLYRLALSATPKRRDGNEELLYKLCGPLLYTLSYRDLLKLRIVAPIEEYKVFFVTNKIEKIRKLLEILNENKGLKVFIFTQYLSTANEIYGLLATRGYKVALITGKTPSSKRSNAFNLFTKCLIDIVVTTTVLDEGVTVPDAQVAIIYENSGEARQLIQRIGRVLGYKPGKTAKVYEIVNLGDTKEKYAYLRRKWVQELYIFPELRKYVELEKSGKHRGISYQTRIDAFN